jgi:low affinity Fe/Cu permease
MMNGKGFAKRFGLRMEAFSRHVSDWTGSTQAIVIAFAIVIAWLLAGPLFHFSDTWQLVINTSTTVVTFLMVFLIQRAQNKGAKAMSLKLNELIASIEGSSNRLIDVEALSEEDLETLHRHYRTLVAMAKRDSNLTRSHSIEEAEHRHAMKAPGRLRGNAGRGRDGHRTRRTHARKDAE